jgi:hypothetical protein
MKGDGERKEVAVAYLKVMPQHLPEGNEQKDGRPQSRGTVTRPRFEVLTSRIRNNNSDHSVARFDRKRIRRAPRQTCAAVTHPWKKRVLQWRVGKTHGSKT